MIMVGVGISNEYKGGGMIAVKQTRILNMYKRMSG